jgi:hypothetical protein
MNDDKYVYVFVRQDIPAPQQVVHTAHAAWHAGQWFLDNGIPNMIIIGVPHRDSLDDVQFKLVTNGVKHYCWRDPDSDEGMTAIATEPLDQERKQILKNYRLYR